MKRAFHILFSVFILLTMGSTAFSVRGYSEEPPPVSCAIAENYFQAGAIDQAETAYMALLKTGSDNDCAILGLRRVAEERCELAKKMVASGHLEDAKTLCTSVLKAYPDLQCAMDVLKMLPTSYNEVESLVKIGDYSKAWEKFETAIETHPDDPRVKTFSRQRWAQLQTILLWLKYFLEPIATGILAIAVFLVACCWLRRRLRLRLDVVGFDSGMVTLEASSDNNKKPESLLIALFEQALTVIASEARKLRRPDLIDAPLEATDFPTSIQTIPKNISEFYSFISKLIPANIVELKGTLQYDPRRGAGLYVKLVHSRTHKLWGSFTVWQNELDLNHSPAKDPPGIDAFRPLVEFAAISAYWEIFRHRGLNLRRIFGTDNARSYYISTRLVSPRIEQLLDRSFPQGDEDTLRKQIASLSRQALSHDRRNYTAYLHLGQTLRNIDYIMHARSNTKPLNPVRITANYLLGTLETIKCAYADRPDEKTKHLESSLMFLGEAVKSAKKNAKRRRKTKISDDYIAMLTIPYASVLCWSGAQRPKKSKPERMIEKIIKEHPTSGRVLYNLACHFSMDCLSETPSDDAMDKALHYLTESLAAMPSLVEYVKTDPTLQNLRQKRTEKMETLMEKYANPETIPAQPAETEPAAEPAGLADLLGSNNLKILQTAGVESADDFLQKTSARDRREALAEQCFINEDMLLHWAKAVEMVLVRGIEIDHVVLLDAVGISSLESLSHWKQRDLAELHDKLTKAHGARFQNITLPEIETLERWIDLAKHIRTQVEK